MDVLLNGAVQNNSGGFGGQLANILIANNFSPHCLRSFIGQDGQSYQTVETGKLDVATQQPQLGVMRTNAAATLRRDEWIHFDQAVVKVSRQRLRAWGDLTNAGLTYNVPNALGKMVVQHTVQGDIDPAIISMDGLRQSDRNRVHYDVANLPLPLIHKDFSFSARELAASRNGNTPLDTTHVELATRKVAEEAEKLLIGLTTVPSYGGGTVYGYTNFPQRLTKSLQDPLGGTWTPAKTLGDVLAMKQQSVNAFHYGPWVLYVSPNWDIKLDDDFSAAKGDITLRDRILKVKDIADVRTLDYLTGYQMILVSMTSDVVQAITGMPITTVQWESAGGMALNFKVMAIMVPRLRVDGNGNTGIVHGVV